MPIQIRDVTAGVLLLTIDNTGLICFGNGTPVDQLSVNGVATIDSHGLITNQRLFGSGLVPTTGTVICPPGNIVSVATLSGRTPTVQLDTNWPAVTTSYVNKPGTPAHCEFTYNYAQKVHRLQGLSVGGFGVRNNDLPDDMGLCSTGHSDDAIYRWF
jgi:hypothetical protein